MDAHPRLLASLGPQTLAQVHAMDVLVVGARGLGAEVAKCLLQLGVHSLTLHDDELVAPADVRTNFCLRESDVRAARAEAALLRLRQLATPATERLERLRGPLQAAALTQFHVVVVTEAALEQLIVFDEVCRAADPPVGFIVAESRGVAGYVFTDFGPEYAVLDPTGQRAPDALVNKIHFRRDGEARVFACEPHGFSDGDTVVLRELRGCDALNGVPLQVHGCDRLSFAVDGCQGAGRYRGGGVASRAEAADVRAHDSLRNCCVKPLPRGARALPHAQAARAEQLHVAFRGLQAFVSQHQQMPLCSNEDHANEVVRLARQFLDRQRRISVVPALDCGDMDEALVRCVARSAGAELLPLSMALAGFVAQEVVKYTGKGTPCPGQWLYVDVAEALADPDAPLPPSELPVEPADVEDPLPYIFGLSFTQRLRELSALVVGGGGVGAEVVKGLATMGLCSRGAGQVAAVDSGAAVNSGDFGLATDPDALGAPRAQAMLARGAQILPELRTRVVGDDWDGWDGLDVVVAAADSWAQRAAVDQRCVFFRKPWVDSGVDGGMGHVQVVLPDQSECYGDSSDPREAAVPLCTVRNFPNQPEHCALWARDTFRFCFGAVARELRKCVRGPTQWVDAYRGADRALLTLLAPLVHVATAHSYPKCGQLARQLFELHFVQRPLQMLHTLPLAHAVDGVPFWLGPRRPPAPLVFDREDPEHARFVLSAALLFARVAGVRAPDDALEESALRFIPATVPAFKPRSGAVFQVHEADDRPERLRDDDRVVQGCLKEIATTDAQLLSEVSVTPLAFGADDDAAARGFVTAAAQLRAATYGIQGVDPSAVVLTAADQRPAMGTTTTTVAGLALLEACKTVQQKPLEEFRNSFVNLHLPLWVPAEPRPPRPTRSVDVNPATGGPLRAVPENFTAWDKEVVRGPMTVQQLVDVFVQRYEIRTTMVATEGASLYASWNPAHAGRLGRDVAAVYEEVLGAAPSAAGYLVLDLACEDDEGDVTIPTVQYFF